jgi:hypothetical protein
MICAGAAKAFLTERDSLNGPFASEGFLITTDPLTANPAYTRRPSFYTIRALAEVMSRSAPTWPCGRLAVRHPRRRQDHGKGGHGRESARTSR